MPMLYLAYLLEVLSRKTHRHKALFYIPLMCICVWDNCIYRVVCIHFFQKYRPFSHEEVRELTLNHTKCSTPDLPPTTSLSIVNNHMTNLPGSLSNAEKETCLHTVLIVKHNIIIFTTD